MAQILPNELVLNPKYKSFKALNNRNKCQGNLTTFPTECRFLSWPSTRNYHSFSGKIKTHVSSPHAWECYSVCGMSVFSFNELGRNALSPTCLRQGGGHLIAATCWGPSPSGSSSLVWSTSSKQHGSFVTQLYVTMSWSLGASERKKGVVTKERICTHPSSFSLFNVKRDLDLSLVASGLSVLDEYVKSSAPLPHFPDSSVVIFSLFYSWKPF